MSRREEKITKELRIKIIKERKRENEEQSSWGSGSERFNLCFSPCLLPSFQGGVSPDRINPNRTINMKLLLFGHGERAAQKPGHD